MRPLKNRRWILRRRSEGDLRVDDLELVEAPLPMSGEGEVLVRNVYLMVAPTNRVWMSDIEQYMPPVALGEPMRGMAMAVVCESAHPDFRPGDVVEGTMAWEEYSLAKQVRPVPLDDKAYENRLLCGHGGPTNRAGCGELVQLSLS